MAEVLSSNLNEPIFNFSNELLGEYLDIIRLSGVTEDHIKEVNRALQNYLKYILFTIGKSKSLRYFKKLQQENSISYYKKQMYQIRKFLKYLKCDWIDDIKLPKNPEYYPMRISSISLDETLNHFKNSTHFLQIKALLYIGSSSGLRAEELYQLRLEDFDLENCIVKVEHNPLTGQSTKTRKSRVSFFNSQARDALSEYFVFYRDGSSYSKLFPQTTITRLFSTAPIRVKHFRKFFSQEWDRRGGPTSIKKILMGHSLKGDVDLQHYNAQSEEDLKRIYDRVFNDHKILK